MHHTNDLKDYFIIVKYIFQRDITTLLYFIYSLENYKDYNFDKNKVS